MNNSAKLAKIRRSARSRLDEVKYGLVSDIDGRITALNAEEGAPLGMTQPAVVIQDLNSLKGVIQLGKYDAAKIQIGQRAILEYSSNVYEGIVSFISPAASTDLTANTYLRQIDIKNLMLAE